MEAGHDDRAIREIVLVYPAVWFSRLRRRARVGAPQEGAEVRNQRDERVPGELGDVELVFLGREPAHEELLAEELGAPQTRGRLLHARDERREHTLDRIAPFDLHEAVRRRLRVLFFEVEEPALVAALHERRDPQAPEAAVPRDTKRGVDESELGRLEALVLFEAVGVPRERGGQGIDDLAVEREVTLPEHEPTSALRAARAGPQKIVARARLHPRDEPLHALGRPRLRAPERARAVAVEQPREEVQRLRARLTVDARREEQARREAEQVVPMGTYAPVVEVVHVERDGLPGARFFSLPNAIRAEVLEVRVADDVPAAGRPLFEVRGLLEDRVERRGVPAQERERREPALPHLDREQVWSVRHPLLVTKERAAAEVQSVDAGHRAILRGGGAICLRPQTW